MSDDVYIRLRKRLNHGPVRMPKAETFMTVLREFYPVEQAAIAADFPKNAHTSAELARHFKREEKELTAILESMANSGTLFSQKQEDGTYRYALQAFFPGILELQLMRGTKTPRDYKIAKMMDEFLDTLTGLTEMVRDNPEIQKKLPVEAARTIPVEEALPQNGRIYTYEQLSEVVDAATSFAASICYCRHHAELNGEPCQIEGLPEYACLSFNRGADYIVDRGFGKRITQKECREILQAVEEKGLVHNTNNATGYTEFICNCCGCCCGFLKTIRQLDYIPSLAYSNFKLAIDPDSCTICGDCIERCPVEALSIDEDDVLIVNRDRCLGCGNCNSVCPGASLSLVRQSPDKQPPEYDIEKMGI